MSSSTFPADAERSSKTRCQYPGCEEMAVYAGIRCPEHWGIRGPLPKPQPVQEDPPDEP
jgi:hypothetical protein